MKWGEEEIQIWNIWSTKLERKKFSNFLFKANNYISNTFKLIFSNNNLTKSLISRLFKINDKLLSFFHYEITS